MIKSIPDKLWNEIESIFMKKSKVGRPEKDNRIALNGALFILSTGCQWGMLPEKYGSPSTVHGKFMRWCRNGIFKTILSKARQYYQARNKKNNWFAIDSISKKAPLAQFSGKSPTDRAKRGIKHGLIVDRKGAPLFVTISAANTHDSKLFLPLVQQIKKSKNLRIIAADSAFDVKELYQFCKDNKNIALIVTPNPRRKKNVHRFKVPHRWIVEQTFGILTWFRGLKICWNKTIESAFGYLQFACSLRLFKMAGIFG